MKINKYAKILSAGTLSLAIILGAGSDGFAQKGHGKGGGKGDGGGKHESRGGGEREDRGNGGWKQKERGGDDRGRGREMGGWQQQQQQPQIQQRQIWRQPQPVQVETWGGGDRGKGKWKNKDRGEDRRQVIAVPQAPWGGGGWVPPGQIRKAEVHARNAERKAWKDEQKAYKRDEKAYRKYGSVERYDRDSNYSPNWTDRVRRVYRDYVPQSGATTYNDNNYRQPVYRSEYDYNRYAGPVSPTYYTQRYYDNGYGYQAPVQQYYGQQYGQAYPGYGQYYGDQYGYGAPYGGYNDGGSWKQMLIRTLISTVLSGVLNRGGSQDGYYADNDYYANGPVNYGYASQPAYYGGYSPQYAGYNSGYASPYQGYAPQYAGYSPYGGNIGGGLINSLPLGGLLGQAGSGGYLSQVLTQVLAQGYLQGLLAGETARETGYGEDGYYDPFVSQEGVYDPYSYSIGENRRLMSEGYDLGFEDALTGRNQFDPRAVQNVDLVSMFLGNVFSFV